MKIDHQFTIVQPPVAQLQVAKFQCVVIWQFLIAQSPNLYIFHFSNPFIKIWAFGSKHW
jgi:hypothetical protein